MFISKEDRILLNYFAGDQGRTSLEYLAKKLYEYYAHEAVHSEGNQILRNQGAAILAEWLQKLPEGLRNHDASTS